MHRLGLVLVLLSIGLIDGKHFDVKGHHLKGPGFWASYKAKVVELPSPTIEHIAPLPVQQRLVLEGKTHHHVVEPVQERLVVEEKVHVEPPPVIEQVRVVEGVKGATVHHQAVKTHHADLVQHQAVKTHHQDVVLQQHADVHHADVHHDVHHDLSHERRHEELHQQREQREQLREIQHFQQIQQHEQIRQQLEQQKHLETVAVSKTNENCEKPAQIVQTHDHIEQIIQQKQERNEKLTVEEEAIAEPFPLIPKTSFTCDDKPVLPGLYADLETGCRVYHFCFAREKKADIVEQVHQDRVDELHHDVHHVNSLLVHHLPQPEQQQMKSFFCGEGTLFSQRLLICDHAVNVVCPESIHFYSSNLEFGKPSAEPAAQLVQQREITKTNHIVQLVEPPRPIVQVTEKIVQSPPVEIVQHHDAIKIVEPPKQIVQVREQIVQEPVVQVREQIVQAREPVVQVREQIVEAPVKGVVHHPEPVHIVQAPVKTVVHHPEPARIVQEQVKVGHLVEEPIVQQRRTNSIVHEDRFVTTSNAGSFASASNQDWKEDRSWSTSRTVWGNTLNGNNTNNGAFNGSSNALGNGSRQANQKEATNTTSTSASSSSSSSSSSSASSSSSSSSSRSTDAEWSSSSSSNNESGRLQSRPVNRRFLGELMTSNIPTTKFTCENMPFQAGFYADVATNCKIYHKCVDGRKSTYSCNQGTLFNQRNLSCDFEEKVKCSESEQYYRLNAEFN